MTFIDVASRGVWGLKHISEIVAHDKWQHFWFRSVPINWSERISFPKTATSADDRSELVVVLISFLLTFVSLQRYFMLLTSDRMINRLSLGFLVMLLHPNPNFWVILVPMIYCERLSWVTLKCSLCMNEMQRLQLHFKGHNAILNAPCRFIYPFIWNPFESVCWFVVSGHMEMEHASRHRPLRRFLLSSLLRTPHTWTRFNNFLLLLS